ncbi:unnamed protein product [Gemmata massiliana]|uniref:Uncharacterized protein n=1 Tax=Gemmata massiliana TaxID=1210884 RepID=A0A6P2D934_9BACT|nr:hypothetical protein [Gemmata massiliana]VTR97861.1 unnamed protein product [Gemmata massiliana]
MSRKTQVHCPECDNPAHDTGFDVKPRLYGCNQCGHTFTHKPPKKKRTPQEQAVVRAQRNVKRVQREVAFAVKVKNRKFAQDECSRALAAWIMAIRARFDEIFESVQAVYFAARKEDCLLHGLICETRLERIYSALGDVEGDIPLLTVDCEIRDPVEFAGQVKESGSVSV